MNAIGRRVGLAVWCAGAVLLAATAGLASGCGPKCEPQGGTEICLNPDLTCLPEAPQICPELNPIPFCDVVPGLGAAVAPHAGAFEFDFYLVNNGTAPLVINSVRLVSDERCAVGEVEVSPMGPIPSLDSFFIRFWYDPPDLGEDHIYIEIDSNAENFPLLPIGICGRGAMTPLADPCLFCEEWTPGLVEMVCP